MTSRTEYCTQTPIKPSLFDVQYLRNHRTLDIGVLGYIGIVSLKEHSPEVRSFPPGTPCILLKSMPATVLKPTIPANNGPQTHTLDHIANRLLPFALFPQICPLCLKHKFAVTPSGVY